jgi:hypothetical protein
MYLEGSLGMSVADQETFSWRGNSVANSLSDTSLWIPQNTGATNSSGFTALPGGCRYGNGSNGIFNDLNVNGYWYTYSELSSGLVVYRGLNSFVLRDDGSKQGGFSIRCLKD